MTGPRTVVVEDATDIPAALLNLDLHGPRPVVVLVGGAGGLDGPTSDALDRLLRDHVEPVLARLGAVVVDGGTAVGVMACMGAAVEGGGRRLPLVGVAAVGTVEPPVGGASHDGADLDPHHTGVLLVPGADWGDESPWIDMVATQLADGAASVTVAANGGEITYDDAARSVASGRPVVVLEGTGRTADAIAGAVRGRPADDRAVAMAASGLIHVVAVADGDRVAELIEVLLSRGDGGRGEPTTH